MWTGPARRRDRRAGAAPEVLSERAVLLAVALATTLAPLNSTMIAVALPHILGEFRAAMAASGWLITTYLATMAVLQPFAGQLGDRVGRRRLVLAGLAWFGVASLGAAAAGSFPVLVIWRVQQAAAGAVALPNAAALVREVLPASRRARGFGLIGALVGVAAAAGPPLGAAVLAGAGWRAMFLVNVPVVLGALLLVWRALPAVVPATQPASHQGATLALGLFRRRSFAAASAAVAFSNLAFYVALLVLPLLLATSPGRTTAEAGVLLALLTGASLCCSPLGGYLADRLGRRWPTVGGLLLFTAGIGALALAASRGALPPLPLLAASLVLAGSGLGLSGAGMQTAAVEASGAANAGAAAGLYSTSRYLGSVAGSAAMAGLLARAPGEGGGFGAVFVLMAAAAVLSVFAGLWLHDRPALHELYD